MKVVEPLIAIMLVVAALALSATVVLGVAAAVVLFRCGRRLWRRHREHLSEIGHQRAELLARAELQHRWYLDGDPRGTYGRWTPAA